MARARVNGIHIHYEVHGSGEPLLLIMGLGANTTGWSMQIPEFSKEYCVIAFDNRGAGRSDKPNEPYSMRQMADDARGLLDELEIDSAHVFGMSLGGMIAQELVLQHPHRVSSLVLGGTMAGGPSAIFAGPDVVQQFISLAGMALTQAIEAGLALVYSEEYVSANKRALVRRSLLNAHLIGDRRLQHSCAAGRDQRAGARPGGHRRPRDSAAQLPPAGGGNRGRAATRVRGRRPRVPGGEGRRG